MLLVQLPDVPIYFAEVFLYLFSATASQVFCVVRRSVSINSSGHSFSHATAPGRGWKNPHQ
jgi:hypothetical protein